MDEKLINHYINVLATRMNELNLENILLKSKLTLATEELNELKNAKQENLNGDSNKTKAK
jgi:hypothetical protein